MVGEKPALTIGLADEATKETFAEVVDALNSDALALLSVLRRAEERRPELAR